MKVYPILIGSQGEQALSGLSDFPQQQGWRDYRALLQGEVAGQALEAADPGPEPRRGRRRTIAKLREIVSGLRAVFLAFGT